MKGRPNPSHRHLQRHYQQNLVLQPQLPMPLLLFPLLLSTHLQMFLSTELKLLLANYLELPQATSFELSLTNYYADLPGPIATKES